MIVWTTNLDNSHGKVHFHANPDCKRLRVRRKPLLPVELDEIRHPEPCRTCYPTAPVSPSTWRPHCDMCYGAGHGPCQHNGGVLVWVEQQGRWPGKMGTGTFDRSAVQYRKTWVWPDNAHHYRLVEEDADATYPGEPAALSHRQRR